MKTNLTHYLKTAFCLVFLSGVLPLATNAQSTTTISRPGNSMDYKHNRINWVHTTNSAFTYNNKGVLTLDVKTDPVTNQYVSKTDYTLDSLDKVTLISDYLWQSNTWALSYRSNFIRTYNAKNEVTESISQVWKNGALVNDRKTNNVYDAAGNIIEKTVARWDNNNWENESRSTSTYVNGMLTERLTEGYSKNTASWRPTFKYSYAGWHSPGVRHTSYVCQIYNATTGWTNFDRSTITMGQNGSYEELLEGYQNGNWQYYARINTTYDVHGNATDYLYEEFINGTWRMVWTDKGIFTYNAQNDLLEVIFQGQDTASGPIRNQTRYVYSNFQYFTRALGTAKDQKASLNLNIYPNPAQDILHIELAENTQKLQKATVSDLTGKAVLTQTFEVGNRQQLHVENLRPGIYLLNLETDKGAIVKKFVKQ